MYIKKNDKLTLIKEGISDGDIKINHYIKWYDDYDINIICCEFSKKEFLENDWHKVVENIAMYIQMEIEEEIEYYNIYTIFFFQEKDKKLSSTIESNKYSSRKIVIDKKMPESEKELEEIIDDRLFNIKIEEYEKIEKISSNIENEYLKMIGIIEDDKCKLDEKINKLIKYRKE